MVSIFLSPTYHFYQSTGGYDDQLLDQILCYSAFFRDDTLSLFQYKDLTP